MTMRKIDALSTRLLDYVQTIRSSLWKNGERNVLQNLERGIRYEGIIEIWEDVSDKDDDGEQ